MRVSRQYIEKAKQRQRFMVPERGRSAGFNSPTLAWASKPDDTILDIVRNHGFEWHWESYVWYLPQGNAMGRPESRAAECYEEIVNKVRENRPRPKREWGQDEALGASKQRLDKVAEKYRGTLEEARAEIVRLKRKVETHAIDVSFWEASLDKQDAEIKVLRSELKERYEGAAAKAEPVKPKRMGISCQNDEEI